MASQLPTLPKTYVDMIPVYKGDPKKLLRFLHICDLIHGYLEKSEDRVILKEIFAGIVSAKIQDKAQDEIANCDQSSWATIRTALVDTYSDKRDIGTLTKELFNINQQNGENAFEYLQRLKQHVYYMNSYLDTHPMLETEIAQAKAYNRVLVLRQAIEGLKQPLQVYVKGRKPSSLEEIHNVLVNEFSKEASVKYFSAVSTSILSPEI